jgi:hypothetical protein
MSYHLAARYSRPDSSIMINVDHSSCLALAGTFEPCYILTISALPSQMQATTNKRNAALIQSFMADILSVPPERGIVKFVPVPEENYAFNGSTLFGEIERLEQQQLGNGGAKRAITDVRKSMPAFSAKRTTSKNDINFARKVDHADSFDDHIEESQNDVVPAPLKPQLPPLIPDVFELASYKRTDDRPSTANGTPSNNNFAALNGLRLNGITKEDLEGPDTKTPFGRPKTISGGPVWSSSEDFNLTPRRGSDEGAPSPVVKSEPRQLSKDLRKSPLPDFNKPNSRSSTPVQKHTPTATMTSPAERTKSPTITSTTDRSKTPTISSTTEKTKPAYLENPPKSALAKSHSRSKSKTSSPPEALPLPQDDGTAANTAKRRSTANGGSHSSKVPPPPPVPESKQAKISKRKSFLSAFRSR